MSGGRTAPVVGARLRELAGVWGPLLPVLLLLSLFMVLPVGQLLALSWTDRDGAPTLQHYQRLLEAGVYVRVLLITFKIAAWTALLTVLFSYPVAYLIAASPPRWRARLTLCVLLPFWTSFLVRTFAWLVLLGREGLVNDLLRGLGLADASLPLLYNLAAVLVGMVHALMPLCILTMVSVMEGIDPNLPKAALTLGAPPGSAFWRVYFPLSMPGVAAGALLVFVTALGFFVTPAFLGGRRETMITQIIIEQVTELLNWRFAGAVSLLLLVTTLVVFYLYDRLLGLSTLVGSPSAPAAGRPRGLDRALGAAGLRVTVALGAATDRLQRLLERAWPGGRREALARAGRWALRAFGAAVLLFLTLPAFVMVPISFGGDPVIDWPPRGFSLQWYQRFWSSPVWVEATIRSFTVGALAAILATAIGAPAAFALARRRFVGKAAVLGFIVSPMIVPRIIIAVSLFYLFARIGLVGTSLGLVLGHAVLAVPYVVITLMAALKTYDERLDLAAAILGANRIRTLLRVTFPILRVGVISAFLFAFITSFDELTIALFVTGGLTSTLPKQMWDDAILRVTPTLAAASTLLLAFVSAVILLTDYLQRRAPRG